jgi:CRISPR-associated protein Cas5d
MLGLHTLEVWGDLACFTRPELKAERMSYPVITPSAARGIFDAVYVKPPEFRWQVRRIEVLAEPSYLALRRNEVKDKVNPRAVGAWMGGEEPVPIWADGDRQLLGTDEKGRTQRQTMALRNVRYRLTAEIRPWPSFQGHPAALDRQFERRARGGKCFQQPYLGCREFPAYFRWVEPGEIPAPPIDRTEDLGFMVYDVFDLSRPGSPYDGPFVSLFRARLEKGVLEVPDWDDPDVLKPGRAA